MFNNFFFGKSYRLCNNAKNMVLANRPQITMWRLRIACLITKATDTYSEYVIIMHGGRVSVAGKKTRWSVRKIKRLPVLHTRSDWIWDSHNIIGFFPWDKVTGSRP